MSGVGIQRRFTVVRIRVELGKDFLLNFWNNG